MTGTSFLSPLLIMAVTVEGKVKSSFTNTSSTTSTRAVIITGMGDNPSSSVKSIGSPISCPSSSTMVAEASTPTAFTNSGLFPSSSSWAICTFVLAKAMILLTSALILMASLTILTSTLPWIGVATTTGSIVLTTTVPLIPPSGDNSSPRISKASGAITLTVPFNTVLPFKTIELPPPPAKVCIPPSPSVTSSRVTFSTPAAIVRLTTVPFFTTTSLPLMVRAWAVCPPRFTTISSPITLTMS